MSKYIFVIFVATLAFISCGSNTKNSPQNIIEKVEVVEKIVSRYDNNIQSAIEAKNFSYIRLISKTAIDSCNIRLNEVKTIEVLPSDDAFKETAISYIVALQEIIKAEEEYSSLTDSTSVTEAYKLDDRLMKASAKAKNEYTKYQENFKKLNLKD